jgi:Fe-S-cluster containining protein
MCCSGVLSGSVRGEPMYPGRPCKFLNAPSGCSPFGESTTALKGCTIYIERPSGCKKYKCMWLSEEDIPEFMKPENANAIFDKDSYGEIEYLRLTENEGGYSEEVLQFAVNEAIKRNMNLIFQWQGLYSYYGDKEVCSQILEDEYKIFI